MLTATPKLKECAECKTMFMPQRPMARVCSPRCALKTVKTAKVAERTRTKARKAAAETIPELKALAQTAFNAYIRARDADLPCISCDTLNPPMKPGGQWDAGHFLGRGAYPELRYNEDNCHKQCKSCNGGSGKFAHKSRTVAQEYEERLAARIGPDRLEALKAPHPPAKWTREELREIRATYQAKLKQLQKERS